MKSAHLTSNHFVSNIVNFILAQSTKRRKCKWILKLDNKYGSPL